MLGVGSPQGLVRPKQSLGGHGTATSPELRGTPGGLRAGGCGIVVAWWWGAVCQGTGTTELLDIVCSSTCLPCPRPDTSPGLT